MDLTIVIALYNGERYIDRCLNSIKVAMDNYDKNLNLELLIVNDGSVDNSLDILEQHKKKFKNFKIINKDNGGQSSARNIGIEQASGKFLWLIDVDDEIVENSFDIIFENLDSDVTMFNYNQKSPLKFEKYMDKVATVKNINLSNKRDLLVFSGSAWKFIFKTEFLKNSNLRFITGILYEDLNLTSKLLLEANSISIIDRPIYTYYINAGSIMTSANIYRKKDIIFVLDDVRDYFEKNNKFYDYFDELEYLNIHHILYVAYVSIIQLDKNSDILLELLQSIKKSYPNWRKNKYLKNENIIKKVILYFVGYNMKNLVLLLINIKKFLKRCI